MYKYVSPEIYQKYKHQVLEMSPAIQYYKGTTLQRESSTLTDQEIADRLGLTLDEVTEIRCIAEIDHLPANAWLKAAEWKREKAQRAFRLKRKKETKQ